MLGMSPDAVRKALSAGLFLLQRKVIEQEASAAEALAADMRSNDDDFSEEACAALEYFAAGRRKELPRLEENYEPEPDDIVEVTISGRVNVYDNECRSCGEPVGKPHWSVTDQASDSEFFFEHSDAKSVRVRVIAR
jgi:hypothetical protein